MAVMGDTICDLSTGGEETEAWKALLADIGLTDLTLEGQWASTPTRTPLGGQRGRPSHLGMVAVSNSTL